MNKFVDGVQSIVVTNLWTEGQRDRIPSSYETCVKHVVWLKNELLYSHKTAVFGVILESACLSIHVCPSVCLSVCPFGCVSNCILVCLQNIGFCQSAGVDIKLHLVTALGKLAEMQMRQAVLAVGFGDSVSKYSCKKCIGIMVWQKGALCICVIH